MNDVLLDIKNLKTSFRIKDDYYAAVDDVSLTVRKNEVLAIVGESGSGKSAFAFSIMGLHTRAKIEGEIDYKGINLAKASANQMKKLRGNEMGMIFQDALSALNPLMVVGAQIDEAILLHNPKSSKSLRKKQVINLLRQFYFNYFQLKFTYILNYILIYIGVNLNSQVYL